MRVVRPIVDTTRTVQGAVRDLARLREVAAVLVRYGLGFLLADVKVPGLAPFPRKFESTPERALAAIQELGPTFIKLGQVLSTRPDILPEAYTESFRTLQDDVVSVSFDELEPVLERALGSDWRGKFERIDHEALATGSIAQVHTALLKEGDEVVLKVVRPGIAATIKADLSILRHLATRLVEEFPEMEAFDPLGLLDALDRSLRSETDLQVEAANARLFRRNFAHRSDIKIPRFYEAFTSRELIVIERVHGSRLREARDQGFEMKQIGDRYLSAAYQMIFDDGFFHGDLHPGNVLVDASGVLILLDFGMAGRLTQAMKDDLCALLFSLERGDFRSVSRIYYDLGVKTTRVDYTAFERDVIELMERHWVGKAASELQIGAFLKELADGAVRHGVRAPADYTMFFKAVLTSEGLARSLVPEVDLVAAAQPYVERLVHERFSRERWRQDLYYQAFTLRTLSRRTMRVFSDFVDEVEQGRAKLKIAHELTPADRKALERRTTRATLFGMSASALIADSLTASLPLSGVLGLPWPTVVLWSGAIGFWGWSLMLTVRADP